MTFTTFEEIEAWKEARELTRLVRIFSKRSIEKKDWGWADQISRASLSIMANIAEGNDCQTKPEFMMFLGYAKRSAAEVRSHIYYGFDAAYMTEAEFNSVSERTKKIGAQLAKLIAYLKKTPSSKLS